MGIRVLIADDQPLFRYGLRGGLPRFGDLEVVGEADSGTSAVAQTLALRPDVVLMDVRMPGGDGIDATEKIRRLCPTTQVLILTAFGDVELLRKAAAVGAAGFVLKDISIENLAAAIRAVHHGNTMINPELARQLWEDIAHGGRDTERTPRLTERETEILVDVAKGLSDKEMAAKLFLAESTVKGHLRDIYRKLDIRNRVQAATYAIQNKLVSDDDLQQKSPGKRPV